MNNYTTKDLYKFYRASGGTLAYKPYKDIIAGFHKGISEKILNGYSCTLPHYLGEFKIVRNDRKIKIKENGNIQGAVNWGESNKLKQQIIERGEIPLQCVKDENNIVISTNNGTPWLVYFTDEFYYKWIRVVNVYLHNYSRYTFSPTWTNARALSTNLNEDSELIFNKGTQNAKHQDRRKQSFAAKDKQPIWSE